MLLVGVGYVWGVYSGSLLTLGLSIVVLVFGGFLVSKYVGKLFRRDQKPGSH